MLYAINKSLDDLGCVLQGPPVIFTAQEIFAITVAVDLWLGLGSPYKKTLISTSAKLHYLKNREKYDQTEY